MVRLAVAFLVVLAAAPALATEAGWALLRNGGQVVLLRTTHTAGSVEPANFDIEDCSTQRNLSERGRQQARQLGPLFLARAAHIELVLTSRYCRARHTAELAFGTTPIEPFPPLDLLPTDPEKSAAQTAATIERIRGYSGAGNLIMVTHQANITALTGVVPRQGEAIILGRSQDELDVAARITFN